MTCWCGEENPFFSDDLETHCGGLGELECACGGDFCVCHNHGAVACHGCDDCDPLDLLDENTRRVGLPDVHN